MTAGREVKLETNLISDSCIRMFRARAHARACARSRLGSRLLLFDFFPMLDVALIQTRESSRRLKETGARQN
jgi:hypothetical protein